MGPRHILCVVVVLLVVLDQGSAWFWSCGKSVDCKWSEWGQWVPSLQTRTRGFAQSQKCKGKSCSGSSVDQRAITCPKCPVCSCPSCPQCVCPTCPTCNCPACPKPECPKQEPEPPVLLPEDPEPPVLLPEVPNYGLYGDMMKLAPTGASSKTAKADKLKVSGVEASNLLVDADITDLGTKRQCYEETAKTYNVHPSLIAALASRESRGGRDIKDKDGYGEKSRTYGILGCDINDSGLDCLAHPWDSCEHINMMVGQILLPQIKGVQTKFPDWEPERQLQGGVAAYDAGVAGVETWEAIDDKTKDKDYSNDVTARAQRLVNQHGWVYKE